MTNTEMLIERLHQLEVAKLKEYAALDKYEKQRDSLNDLIGAVSEHIATLRQEIYEVNEALRFLAEE